MSPALLVLACLLAAAPNGGVEQVIDDFQYPDAAAARQAWTASEGTPALDSVAAARSRALLVSAPFASQRNLPRAVLDRRVRLDLASPGEFTLDVECDAPAAIGGLTLYFHSGNGWYGAGGALAKKGRQTLHFSKAAFRVEDAPAGWNQVDTVRIAAWRGEGLDATLRIHRLAAVAHEVAVVIPAGASRAADGELRSAFEVAQTITSMLRELGLGSDAIEDTTLTKGALGGRRVAILGYHPQLDDEAVVMLARFVETGGKVFACYTLPPRLGQALGFKDPRYVREERPGQFAEIRFDAAGVSGMPRAVRQASWNITAASPDGFHARVIGSWHDDAGRPTGHAALLLSDRGAFFSHGILNDDREGKKQMLAAILGHLYPPLWKRMAATAIERAGATGREATLPDMAIDSRKGLETLARAKKLFADGAYSRAIEEARVGHQELVDAYLAAAPSLAREGRAMWNHSGTGAYAGDWDRTAKTLAENGFNMVLPNMLWGGTAHYPSDLLPRSEAFHKHGDQIAQCVAACEKHGLEVHVWKVNFNLSTAPRAFVEKMRGEGRTQVDFRGNPLDWLCPSHPENQTLELESMLEVARKYPVAGLHFDYIRYPGRESCYCEGCRQRFEKETGRKTAEWPREVFSGSRQDEYNDWRCRQITRLVAAVHGAAKKLRPELKISAAVFGAYPDCRRSVAQDWPVWVEAGYLDFVCPMDYSESDLQFSGWVENQRKLVGKRIPLYPGIGATASSTALPVDRVVGQILHARRLGSDGFCIFNLDRGTLGSVVPGIGRGIGRQRAEVPESCPGKEDGQP